MIEFTIYEPATGKILRAGHVPSQEDADRQCMPGEGLYLGRSGPNQRIVNGELVDDVDLALTSRKDGLRGALERERVRRTTLPISYDGALFDADKKSQDNISDKLQEIGQRNALGLEMPVALLMWRDNANEMHQFPTMAAYQAWLAGLAIAITERGTLAYVWMWEKKAQLDVCTTVSELEELDLS